MKFHPSTNVTPIKGYTKNSAYYNENKYIPTSSKHELERIHSGTNNDGTEQERLGRMVQYETITITTPIMTNTRHSDRSNSNNKKKNVSNDINTIITKQTKIKKQLSCSSSKRHVMSKDDVDEINDRLQALLLNDNKNTRNTKNDKVNNKNKSGNRCYKLNGMESNMIMTKSNHVTTTTTPAVPPPQSSTYFGRCTVMIYNILTNEFIQVVRSARLLSSKK